MRTLSEMSIAKAVVAARCQKSLVHTADLGCARREVEFHAASLPTSWMVSSQRMVGKSRLPDSVVAARIHEGQSIAQRFVLR